MATVQSLDDIFARIGGGYTKTQQVWGEQSGSPGGNVFSAQNNSWCITGWSDDMPGSLPTGVTAFIPASVFLHTNTSGGAGLPVIVAKAIELGSFNVGTNTFTDGSAMPTQTVGGNSLQIASPVMAEITTVLNGTPGSITITYVDQSGNASETTAAAALSGSAAVGSCGFIPLNTGDWGVRDISAAARTGGSSHSGVIRFWGLVPFFTAPFGLIGSSSIAQPIHVDMLTGKMNFMRLGVNDKIRVFCVNAGVPRAVLGCIQFVGDS